MVDVNEKIKFWYAALNENKQEQFTNLLSYALEDIYYINIPKDLCQKILIDTLISENTPNITLVKNILNTLDQHVDNSEDQEDSITFLLLIEEIIKRLQQSQYNKEKYEALFRDIIDYSDKPSTDKKDKIIEQLHELKFLETTTYVAQQSSYEELKPYIKSDYSEEKIQALKKVTEQTKEASFSKKQQPNTTLHQQDDITIIEEKKTSDGVIFTVTKPDNAPYVITIPLKKPNGLFSDKYFEIIEFDKNGKIVAYTSPLYKIDDNGNIVKCAGAENIKSTSQLNQSWLKDNIHIAVEHHAVKHHVDNKKTKETFQHRSLHADAAVPKKDTATSTQKTTADAASATSPRTDDATETTSPRAETALAEAKHALDQIGYSEQLARNETEKLYLESINTILSQQLELQKTLHNKELQSKLLLSAEQQRYITEQNEKNARGVIAQFETLFRENIAQTAEHSRSSVVLADTARNMVSNLYQQISDLEKSLQDYELTTTQQTQQLAETKDNSAKSKEENAHLTAILQQVKKESAALKKKLEAAEQTVKDFEKLNRDNVTERDQAINKLNDELKKIRADTKKTIDRLTNQLNQAQSHNKNQKQQISVLTKKLQLQSVLLKEADSKQNKLQDQLLTFAQQEEANSRNQLNEFELSLRQELEKQHSYSYKLALEKSAQQAMQQDYESALSDLQQQLDKEIRKSDTSDNQILTLQTCIAGLKEKISDITIQNEEYARKALVADEHSKLVETLAEFEKKKLTLEKESMAITIQKLQSAMEAIEQAFKSKEQENLALQEQATSAIKTTKEEIQQLTEQLDTIKEKQPTLEEEITTLTSQIKEKQDEIRQLQASQDKLNEQLTQLQESNDSLQTKNSNLQHQLNKKLEQVTAQQVKLLENKTQISRLQADTESLQQQIANTKESLKENTKILETKEKELKESKEKSEEEKKQLQLEIAELNQKNKDTAEYIQAQNTSLASNQQEMKALQSELTKKSTELKTSVSELRKVKDELQHYYQTLLIEQEEYSRNQTSENEEYAREALLTSMKSGIAQLQKQNEIDDLNAKITQKEQELSEATNQSKTERDDLINKIEQDKRSLEEKLNAQTLELESKKEELNKNQQHISQLESDLVKHQTDIDTLKAALEKEQNALSTAQKSLDIERLKTNQSTGTIEALSTEIASHEDKIKAINTNMTQVQQMHEAANHLLIQQQQQNLQLLIDLEQNTRQDIEEAFTSENSLLEKQKELLDALNDVHLSLAVSSSDNESLLAKQQRLNKELEDTQASHASAVANKYKAEEQTKAAKIEMERARDEAKLAINNLRLLQAEVKDSREEVSQLQEKLYTERQHGGTLYAEKESLLHDLEREKKYSSQIVRKLSDLESAKQELERHHLTLKSKHAELFSKLQNLSKTHKSKENTQLDEAEERHNLKLKELSERFSIEYSKINELNAKYEEMLATQSSTKEENQALRQEQEDLLTTQKKLYEELGELGRAFDEAVKIAQDDANQLQERDSHIQPDRPSVGIATQTEEKPTSTPDGSFAPNNEHSPYPESDKSLVDTPPSTPSAASASGDSTKVGSDKEETQNHLPNLEKEEEDTRVTLGKKEQAALDQIVAELNTSLQTAKKNEIAAKQKTIETATKKYEFIKFCEDFLKNSYKGHDCYKDITQQLDIFKATKKASDIKTLEDATEIYKKINSFIFKTTAQKSDAVKPQTPASLQNSFKKTAKEKLKAIAKQQLSFSAFDLLSSTQQQDFNNVLSSLQNIKSTLSRANSNPDIQITRALDKFVEQVVQFNQERDKIINNKDFPYNLGSPSEMMSLKSYNDNLNKLADKLSTLNQAIQGNKEKFKDRKTNEPPYELQAKIEGLERLVKDKPNPAQASLHRSSPPTRAR